jgi:hypothetical protein
MISNPRPLGGVKSLVVADGISDGSAHAEYVVGAEHVGVVLNVVVVNFGAHEKVVPHVVADAAAQILHEVITGGVVDATGEVAARGGVGHIEAGAGDADAAKEISADFLSQLGLEQRIEVGEDGTIGFVAEVARLTRSPGSLHIEAEAPLEADNISADAEIRATFFRNVAIGQRSAIGRGRYQGAAKEHNVALLGGGEVAREQQGEDRCEKS